MYSNCFSPWGFGQPTEIFRAWALTQGFIFTLVTLLFVCLGTWYTKGVVTCTTFHKARRNMIDMQPMEGNNLRMVTRKRMKWCSVFHVLSPIFCEEGWTLVVSHVGKFSKSGIIIIISDQTMLTILTLYCTSKLTYIYISSTFPTEMDLQMVDFSCCNYLIPGECQNFIHGYHSHDFFNSELEHPEWQNWHHLYVTPLTNQTDALVLLYVSHTMGSNKRDHVLVGKSYWL